MTTKMFLPSATTITGIKIALPSLIQRSMQFRQESDRHATKRSFVFCSYGLS
jgi:hypothetical protein